MTSYVEKLQRGDIDDEGSIAENESNYESSYSTLNIEIVQLLIRVVLRDHEKDMLGHFINDRWEGKVLTLLITVRSVIQHIFLHIYSSLWSKTHSNLSSPEKMTIHSTTGSTRLAIPNTLVDGISITLSSRQPS